MKKFVLAASLIGVAFTLGACDKAPWSHHDAVIEHHDLTVDEVTDKL